MREEHSADITCRPSLHERRLALPLDGNHTASYIYISRRSPTSLSLIFDWTAPRANPPPFNRILPIFANSTNVCRIENRGSKSVKTASLAYTSLCCAVNIQRLRIFWWGTYLLVCIIPSTHQDHVRNVLYTQAGGRIHRQKLPRRSRYKHIDYNRCTGSQNITPHVRILIS